MINMTVRSDTNLYQTLKNAVVVVRNFLCVFPFRFMAVLLFRNFRINTDVYTYFPLD